MIKPRHLPFLISSNLMLSGLVTVCIAAPSGGTVISESVPGSTTISVNNPTQTTTIDQGVSQNVAINWNSFNVGATETVNFVQPNVSSIALNRDFQGSPSQIFGNINANGHVFLLNTSGVLIGSSASINVGSLFISDLNVTENEAADFANFDINSNGGQLPFSDQDLAQGGIEVRGSITTTAPNGLTLMGQYIYINDGGNTFSTNGDTNINIAGSAVLVTDPSGLYGVQLGDPVTQDISPTDLYPEGALYSVSSDPSTSVQTSNGDININVKYSTELNVTPVGLLPNHLAIPGKINYAILAVAPPDTLTEAEQEIVDGTLSDSLFEEPEEEGSQLVGDSRNTSENNLDNLMEDCQPNDLNRKDCLKKQALKRYLGKLLIGGNLPD